MERGTSQTTPYYRWGAIGWTLAIIAACTIPPFSLSPVDPILSFDKAIHFGLFLLFGGLWMRVLCPLEESRSTAQLRRRGIGLFLVGSLFSGGLELYQQLLPFRRVADPYDALANGIGLLAGILLYAFLVRGGGE